MSAEAFPLYWPEGWPRTRSRLTAKYKVGLGVARDHLLNELRLMGAGHVVLSTNIPTRRDGLPYADFARNRIGDPGVAVYFLRRGQQQVIACDKWTDVVDNVRAVGLTVEALRGIARAGATELLDRAFTGFKALPPPGGTTPGTVVGTDGPAWWLVLKVPRNVTLDDAQSAYRSLARQNHPDLGGDAGAMAAINRAWEQAQAALVTSP